MSSNHTVSRVALLWLALLFGCVGAITWAIRGTTGWGGIDGAIVPGMAWGILWYWAARRWDIDVRHATLWLGLGIAIGGEFGYGQYVSWLRGEFYHGDSILPVNPAVGIWWFILCGIAWGGPGGIALCWALNARVPLHQWLVRIHVPIGLALAGRALIQMWPSSILPHYGDGIYAPLPDTQLPTATFLQTAPFMWLLWAVCSVWIVAVWAMGERATLSIRRGVSLLAFVNVAFAFLWIGRWLFFPQDNLGLADGELDRHLARTVYTNAQNALIVVWWIGATLVALAQRDRWTVIMSAIIGAGFGLGMAQSALWCIGYIYSHTYIDWWKLWELNAGFNLGVLYLVALYVYARRRTVDESNATPILVGPAIVRTLASAAGVFLIWYYLYWEDGMLSGLFLGPVYVAAAAWVCYQGYRRRDAAAFENQTRDMALFFTTFYLIYFLIHGATTRLGVYLELYNEADTDQYAWPTARLWLFAIIGIPTAIAMIPWLTRVLRGAPTVPIAIDALTRRITILTMVFGFVGALSIWPSKIGVVYAAVMIVGIASLTQLNQQPVQREP